MSVPSALKLLITGKKSASDLAVRIKEMVLLSLGLAKVDSHIHWHGGALQMKGIIFMGLMSVWRKKNSILSLIHVEFCAATYFLRSCKFFNQFCCDVHALSISENSFSFLFIVGKVGRRGIYLLKERMICFWKNLV